MFLTQEEFETRQNTRVVIVRVDGLHKLLGKSREQLGPQVVHFDDHSTILVI
jgi:hypothetical protein